MRTGPAGADRWRAMRCGDRRDRARRGVFGVADEDRLAAVAALAQRRLERHLAEQRDAELLRERPRRRPGRTGHVASPQHGHA